MISDRNNNRRVKDPMVSYIHNREINKLFRDAQGRAWGTIMDHPAVIRLQEQKRLIDASQPTKQLVVLKTEYYDAAQTLLMPK